MRVVSLVAVLLITLLSACASTAPMVAGAPPSDPVARAKATTLASGWRVDCTTDQYKAETSCYAGTFGKNGGGYFQVLYLNGAGPTIETPNDFPGRVATVRIDSGAVYQASDAKSIIEAMQTGTEAFVVYNVWPRGEEKMVVPISGFAEAYALLLTKI